jgi:hypothetical protein
MGCCFLLGVCHLWDVWPPVRWLAPVRRLAPVGRLTPVGRLAPTLALLALLAPATFRCLDRSFRRPRRTNSWLQLQLLQSRRNCSKHVFLTLFKGSEFWLYKCILCSITSYLSYFSLSSLFRDNSVRFCNLSVLSLMINSKFEISFSFGRYLRKMRVPQMKKPQHTDKKEN